MKSISITLLFLAFFFWSGNSQAKIITKSISYNQEGAALEGYLAYDSALSQTKKIPAILIIHDWMGLSADTKMRAEQMAKMGYVGFAADIYGVSERPKNQEDAKKISSKYKSNPILLLARANAAIAQLEQLPFVDKNKLVAMGFCFGGTTVLELARSGAPLKGIVSFHGGLHALSSYEPKQIKGKILALHGADDPYVPVDEVKSFEEEMRVAKADWQLIAYGNAVHAFTVKAAGNDPSKGAAYNPVVEKRSFQAFQIFLKEIL